MRNLSLAKWLQKRYLISMLICLGIAIIILLQLSMSIAIVQMTRPQEVTVGNKTYTTVSYIANNFLSVVDSCTILTRLCIRNTLRELFN